MPGKNNHPGHNVHYFSKEKEFRPFY